MKKVMWIVSMIPFVMTAVVLQFMPDLVPMHYDSVGNIDRWGSKYENLIVPIIILVNALLLYALMRHFEKKANKAEVEKEQETALSNVKALGIIGTAVSVFFGLLQCILLYNAYEGAITNATTAPADLKRVAYILMLFLFIVLGILIPKTRAKG